jgi:hypothetical protein
VCGVVVYPILELLCVCCGSVSYPRALCFFFVNVNFNYALYIDFKNNCSAVVNGTAPQDGDV